MWGRLDKAEKIVIAKERMTELVREFSNDTSIGLMIYDRCRKGNCEKIEMLVPLGKSNKDT